MKKGLILEGGAMRCLFTMGVLDVLMENGMTFDGMIGVSAGASFGCNFKSGQRQRALRYNIRYAHDIRYCSILSCLTTANLYNAKFAYHTVAEKLDIFDKAAIEANPMECHLVATDVETGKPVYRKMEKAGTEVYEWLRASSAMPIVARMVEREGKKLLDGGITDSIPLQYFQSIGYERNLVILTQPSGFRKKPMRIMPLLRMWLRRYPNVTDALQNRYQMYNAELDYIAEETKNGRCLIICPEDTLPISRISHNRKRMRLVYEMGRQTALGKIEEIREFLGFQATPHQTDGER